MQNCNNQSYCRYCGYMIDADSKYCIYCGVKVSYSNTSYYKLKRVVLKFFKVILGTIMAVFGGLIPFLIAYLLFPYTLCDVQAWMWNFSFTSGVAFLLGCLLCVFTKLKSRNVAYSIVSLLILAWGIMIYVRYQEKSYVLRDEKQADEICTSSLDESWPNDIYDKDNNLLPTQEEIDETNARLPIIVAEGTLFTHVSYDEATKTQTFYYDYTHEIDESVITAEFINQRKALMIQALKDGNTERLEAGVTYLYVYRSVGGRVLYQIQIDSDDL